MNPRLALLSCALAAAAALSSATASAQTTPPYRIDHGDIWFSLSNHFDADGGPAFNAGWSPVVYGALLASERVTPDSAVRFTYRQGTTRIGVLRCPVSLPADPPASARLDCSDSDARFRVSGEVQVDADFIDGQTDAVTPLRTFTLQVGTIARAHLTGVGWIADVSENYVSQHDRLYDAVMVGPGEATVDLRGSGSVRLYVWTSPSEAGQQVIGSFRCSVDGQPLAPPPGMDSEVEWGGDDARSTDLLASRAPTASEGVRAVEDPLRFRRVRITLPITFALRGGVPARGRAWALEDHPGQWACEWRDEGRVVRAFRFAVRDGRLVPHPEQAAGYHLRDGVILADLTVPPDSPIDGRSDPALVRRGSVYGRPWSTDAARARAAAAPSFGQPYALAPSGPVFGPEANRVDASRVGGERADGRARGRHGRRH